MQGLKFDFWNVEMGIPSFLIKARFQPRGDMLIFLNNQTYLSFYFEDIEMLPLGTKYQFKGVKQPGMTINREAISFMSILDKDDLDKMQLLSAKRKIVCYTEWFAIRGDFHVNVEAPDENIFDDKNEFFPLTDVSIFPIRKIMNKPVQKVPALLLNRTAILGYHAHHE
jgi:hypothetical protein